MTESTQQVPCQLSTISIRSREPTILSTWFIGLGGITMVTCIVKTLLIPFDHAVDFEALQLQFFFFPFNLDPNSL